MKSILEVLHDNKVVVGKFICEVDGYWYFLPGSNNNGLFAEHNLREIADLLRGLNATIEKELKEYFGSLPKEISLDAQDEDFPF